MKVLLINGSPREHGNTYTALHEMVRIFEGENIETEIVHIGEKQSEAVLRARTAERTENVSTMMK